MSILPPAGDISATLLYSSMGMVWRDVGSQVTPNRVNGLPTDREEEQRQVDRMRLDTDGEKSESWFIQPKG